MHQNCTRLFTSLRKIFFQCKYNSSATSIAFLKNLSDDVRQVQFYKIDADTSADALAMLKANGIRSVPTFHIWNGGIRIETVQGAHIDEVEAVLQDEVKKLDSIKQ